MHVVDASREDEEDAHDDVPGDRFGEDEGRENHGDDGLDEEGVRCRGCAAFFDRAHEAEVAEAGHDEADIEQDGQGTRVDARDDGLVHAQEQDELEGRADEEAHAVDGHAAQAADAALAQRRVEPEHGRRAEPHQDTHRLVAAREVERVGDEHEAGHADREHDGFFLREALVDDEVRENHREHRVERDQDRREVGVRVHDAHLEQGHADDDVDEAQQREEADIFAREAVLPLFEVVDRERQQEQAADEEAQERELQGGERAAADLEGDFHRAEREGRQEHPDVFGIFFEVHDYYLMIGRVARLCAFGAYGLRAALSLRDTRGISYA